MIYPLGHSFLWCSEVVSEATGRAEITQRGRQSEKKRGPNTWPINGHKDNGQNRRWALAREVGEKLASSDITARECTRAWRKSIIWEFPGGQRLGLCAFTAEGPRSIPGWGTKIPQAPWPKKKKKRKKKNLYLRSCCFLIMLDTDCCSYLI